MPAGATHLLAKAPLLRGREETCMKLITPKIRTQFSAGYFPVCQPLQFFRQFRAGSPRAIGNGVEVLATGIIALP
jgi:hypothetical protein